MKIILKKRTIKILKMKYKDILNHIREKNLQNFMKKIESKNEGKYSDLVKHLLLTYEDWFKIKNGRNNKKIKSMK